MQESDIIESMEGTAMSVKTKKSLLTKNLNHDVVGVSCVYYESW